MADPAKKILTVLLASCLAITLTAVGIFADTDLSGSSENDTLESASLGADSSAGSDAAVPSYDWYLDNPEAKEFTISNADQLYALSKIVSGSATDSEGNTIKDSFSGKTIRLSSDIELDAYDNWTPIGTVSVGSGTLPEPGDPFAGTFDGQGCSITGLNAQSDEGAVALFGYTTGVLKDFQVSGSVKGDAFCAGVAVYGSGKISSVTSSVTVVAYGNCCGGILAEAAGDIEISGCSNRGLITNEGQSAQRSTGRVGGIVGRVEAGITATITNCSNTANITAYQYIGGIIGGCFGNVTIDSCYNTGDITGISFGKVYVAGIAGKLQGGTISNCYNTGGIYDKPWANGHIRAVGGIAGCEEDHTEGTAISNVYNVGTIHLDTSKMDGKYIYMAANISGGNQATSANTMTYDNCFYLTGSFPAQDDDTLPWSDVYKENRLAYDTEYVTECTEAELKGDEVLALLGEKFDPTGMVVTVTMKNGKTQSVTFTTQLEDGYSVSPYTDALTSSDDGVPVTVSYTQNGVTVTAQTASNLKVVATVESDEDGTYLLKTADDMLWFAEQVNRTGKGNAGVVNAKVMNDIDLSNVTWTPIGTSTSSTYYNGSFDGDGHTITLNISGTSSYLGLFAYVAAGTISNVTVAGSISGGSPVGGIAAYVSGAATIKDCTNKAAVTGGSIIGGIAAYLSGTATIKDCTNKGAVTGTNYVGGIVGNMSGASATIDGCTNEGTITASSTSSSYGGTTGGIVGMAYGAVTNCLNTGAVTGTGNNIGGIVGNMSVKMRNSYSGCVNTAAITGRSDVGGLAGCITYTGVYTGFTNCYNTGAVTSSYEGTALTTSGAGGLVGSYKSGRTGVTISNCYSTGSVTGVNVVTGTLVGYNANGIALTNCYFLGSDTDTACGGTAPNGGWTAKTADGLKAISMADELNAGGTAWKLDAKNAADQINGGYPVLSWQEVKTEDYTVTFMVDSTQYAQETVSYGGKVTMDGISDPSKDYHTFDGWTADNGTTVYTSEQLKTLYVSDNVTYVAVFTPETYAVTKSSMQDATDEDVATYGTDYVGHIANYDVLHTYDVSYAIDGGQAVSLEIADDGSFTVQGSAITGAMVIAVSDVTVFHTVEVYTTPKNATVTITDPLGNTVTPNDDGSYTLIEGDYTYTATADGYKTSTAKFTATADFDLNISLQRSIRRSSTSRTR